MTTLKDIKEAVVNILESLYPKMQIYGADTIEGYKRPSFFVSARLTTLEATKNCIHQNAEIAIDYIQTSPDEEKGMGVLSNIQQNLTPKLVVGDRFLNTSDFDFDFVGTFANIPHLEFQIEYWDEYGNKTEDEPQKMKKLILRQEVR